MKKIVLKIIEFLVKLFNLPDVCILTEDEDSRSKELRKLFTDFIKITEDKIKSVEPYERQFETLILQNKFLKKAVDLHFFVSSSVGNMPPLKTYFQDPELFAIDDLVTIQKDGLEVMPVAYLTLRATEIPKKELYPPKKIKTIKDRQALHDLMHVCLHHSYFEYDMIEHFIIKYSIFLNVSPYNLRDYETFSTIKSVLDSAIKLTQKEYDK
jgi:hypothetical protein